MEMRVVTLGLENAGKTSILFRLKQDEFVQSIPTIGLSCDVIFEKEYFTSLSSVRIFYAGFNVETVEYKNIRFTVWDVGGQPKLRPLWKHYLLNTQAVIYVIDSNDVTQLHEAKNELTRLLQERELRDASLLILANKQVTSFA